MEEINNHLSKVSSENNAQKEALDKLKAEHRAICEVAGFQPFDNPKGNLLYLYAKVDDTGESEKRVSIVIDKCEMTEETACYNKDEVLTVLSRLMESTFPEYVIAPFDAIALPMCTEESYPLVMKQKIGSRVAMQTRRGAANTEFLDFLYYKSNSSGVGGAVDAPFIVYKFGDKYGIFKHPKADQYGFRLIYK